MYSRFVHLLKPTVVSYPDGFTQPYTAESFLLLADITTFRPDLGKYYERFASSATHQMHPSAAPAKRRPSAVSFGAVQTTPAEELLQTLDGRRRANRRSDVGESDDGTRRV